MNITVLSDIHGNHDSLSELLSKKDLGLLFNLGDIFMTKSNLYMPEYNMTLDFPESDKIIKQLIEHNVLSIRGNHDDDLFNNIHKKHKSLDTLPIKNDFVNSLFALIHASNYEKQKNCLDYLKKTPIQRYIEINDTKILFDHGQILSTRSKILNFANNYIFDVAFVGHSHIPKIYRLKDNIVSLIDMQQQQPIKLDVASKYIVDVGSIGNSRIHTHKEHYVSYETDTRKLSFFAKNNLS